MKHESIDIIRYIISVLSRQDLSEARKLADIEDFIHSELDYFLVSQRQLVDRNEKVKQ